MTASTDQGKNMTPAPRRPRSKHAGWKSGLMVAGFGAVVVGAGYLAGTNAPTARATAPTGSAQATGSQPVVIQHQPASQENAALGAQALSGQVFRGTDESEGFSSDDRDNSGSSSSDDNSSGNSGSLNNNSGSAQQLQPRQFRRFRGNASGLGQFGAQQQPQFSAPMTRSRGS
jgi:hypothetical protein